MARERPKRTPPMANGWHVAWRKRVQGMLAELDRLLSEPPEFLGGHGRLEDWRRWKAQRRELVDLLDPGVINEWVETYPLEIQIPCLEG